MEFPSSIHSPRLVGSAGMIMRHEARTSTEQPAIVLVAPPDNHGAASLEAAHKALITLRQDELPFPGCPSLIDYQESSDGGALLALGLRGAPLALAWPDEAVETDVLDLVIQHARLLAALHQAGFSGLQPGFEDLRWDSTHKSLLILGWEWVRENEESQHEDLRAAAALWVELLAGAAPPVFPPMTSETAWPAWQRVSLGTRALLSSILLDVQATATAATTHAQLEAILRNWSQPVDDLLSEGMNLLTSEQFPAAQALFDLAERRDPDSVGSIRLRGTQERATKRFVEIISHIRSDISIGSHHSAYRSAVNKLQRIQGDGALTTEERLRAWRWWTVAEALWRLEPGEQPDKTERLGQELLKAGVDLDHRQIKAALNRVQQALVGEETNRILDGLRFLEADLRCCLLIEQATNLKATDLTIADELYEQAERELQKLPEAYRTAFAAQFGNPAIGLEQVRQKLNDQDLVRRTINEAKAALKANDLPLARQKWNDALRLTERTDPERATIRQELHRVQLRSQAVAAGVLTNPESMAIVEVSAALQALSTLRTAFPHDRWGVAQAKRWQQTLVAWLERAPTGPAGAWLVEYWPKAAEVRRSLEQAAPLALASWQARFADVIRDQELPKTPQHVGDWLQRLDSLLAGLDRSRSWIESTSQHEVLDTFADSILDNQAQIRRFAATQTRLQTQLTAAIDTGVFPFNALAEAEYLALELFDDPDRSVSSLRASFSQQNADQLLPVWWVILAYAHGAWRSGDGKIAQQYFETILANSETPEYVRTFCHLALNQLGRGDSSPLMFVDWDARNRDSTRLSGGVGLDGYGGLDTNTVPPSAEALQPTDRQLLQQIALKLTAIADHLHLLHPDENTILAELERTRELASAKVKKACSEILHQIKNNEFRKAKATLSELEKNDHKELSKMCIEKHKKYFESSCQERKESIQSLVGTMLQRKDLTSEEKNYVISELDVYAQITNDASLSQVWSNRPQTPGRVLR